MILDREQLDALRRQIEEEYKLDMAAIERLQRRFMTSSSSSNSNGRPLSAPAPVSSLPSYMASPSSSEPMITESAPVVELPQERQPDELTGTLRAMFSGQRR
jgi:hypothetical protein